MCVCVDMTVCLVGCMYEGGRARERLFAGVCVCVQVYVCQQSVCLIVSERTRGMRCFGCCMIG